MVNLFISYHFTSKFGDGFGDAVIEDANTFPTNAKGINEIKERIKEKSEECKQIDSIVILNIVELGL